MTAENSHKSSPRVQQVQIHSENAGQRIDNFLVSHLKGVPKSYIYRIVRKGEVRVNKGRIKPDYRLKDGDVVRIPPVRVAERSQAPRPGQQVLERLQASILYEDDRLLVLNKPSGMAVHGGSGVSYGVIEALRALRPDAKFLELVHRLDRDTSGCLLIAKRRSALRAMHEKLREDGMDKRYLALVKGRWQGGGQRITARLQKNTLASGERIVRVSDDGKSALSIFTPVTVYKKASLMEVKIVTGRTHQVRVHAVYAGHPIAGDDKYGDDDFNREMKTLGLKRLFLHAQSLAFEHPASGEPVHVSAPLDDNLRQVLDHLEAT